VPVAGEAEVSCVNANPESFAMPLFTSSRVEGVSVPIPIFPVPSLRSRADVPIPIESVASLFLSGSRPIAIKRLPEVMSPASRPRPIL
jgi:hypothetical protein